ncbi:MAG: T9SS type A sorting domain-containing protein [Bacteroidia bacterium]|nr:T9SS type A sorting domain-containing protein [Bacteroidia bacterium]
MSRNLLLLFSLLLILNHSWAQCPSGLESIYLEEFEQGFPENWSFESGSEGAKWEFGLGGFGNFRNPGENQWIYINDQEADEVGEASFTTEEFDLSAYRSEAELSFDLNFQEFDKHGKMQLEMYSRGNWILLFEREEDLEGKVIIDISELIGTANRFRFSYDDEGVWGWGMGIDNFSIDGRSAVCGNAICEPGENPDNCPGDCPAKEEKADSWINSTENIVGESVRYSNFSGNDICDDCSQKINLNFSFDFYGKEYQSLYINSNGNVSFEEDHVDYVPQAFCLKGPRMIAPFFSDIDLSKGGRINFYLAENENYLIINWQEVAYFGCERPCEKKNSFQLILTDGELRKIGNTILPFGTNVIFTYGDMQWTGGKASGGIEGFGGSPATVGVNSGEAGLCDGYGTFDRSGYFYWGNQIDQSCPANGLDHLDNLSLFFDASSGKQASYAGISELAAERTDDYVHLSWFVDCLKEGGYFEIERSLDSVNFDIIDLLPIETQSYQEGQILFSYQDETAEAGPLLYRVKYYGNDSQEDIDSVGVLFSTSTLLREANPSFEVLSYGPNPFIDLLNVELKLAEAGSISYQLIDMSGRLLKAGKIDGIAGNNSFQLQTSRLSSGMYNLFIRNTKFKQHLRLVKA